ncbi:E3 ubiquitin-protein ligase At1g63170-like [Silene latifolia]|uniref:E3 ubiquitin-protein ligase At1g63170-like n=1 Tax=Silene latifolia TaxID=37657 RepID=UPI003D786EE1
MAISSDKPMHETHTDQYPLLMERHDNHINVEHVINIDRGGEASSSESSGLEFPHGGIHIHSHRETNGSQTPPNGSSASSPSQGNTRSPRSESMGRRNLSPFNSGFWISIELAFTLTQIIASTIVLCLSRHEHPQAPLFAWVVGYTAGCVASLPVMYWRFIHRNRGSEAVVQVNQASPHANSASDQNSYVTISLSRSLEHEDRQSVPSSSNEGLTANTRMGLIMDHFKTALDCFFGVLFVVGNVWIFGGHASVSDAPNLYRLCIVYLTLSCINYAMPFILCAMICCCLPCIISVLGIREDLNQVRGASEESINTLPTYKFKVTNDENGCTGQRNSEEGGIVAIGTEKERVISGEDAVCCICLARYMEDDEMRELPCAHFFHAVCVDRWLKINATCPLCKFEILEREETPPSPPNPEHQT